MATPFPTGWIAPADRTDAENALHAAIVGAMPKFATGPIPAGPLKIRLFDCWKDPKVLADVGFVFPRFHQLTGSCVGAGGGQALFTLIAVQRLLADNPTKAFIPFWPFSYGKSRLRMGSRVRGEGSLGSTFADAVVKDGVIDAAGAGLPRFKDDDGLILTTALEMEWSDGDSPTVSAFDNLAREHPLGTAAECRTVAEIKAAIVNGYPCTFACNNYVGSASVQGSGADARLIGSWDTYGPHQQSVLAYEDNPTHGPIYWSQNNWPGSVYPRDPAGGPVCGCWVKESKVQQALGYDSEVYAFSHLDWFPAQVDKLIDWSTVL